MTTGKTAVEMIVCERLGQEDRDSSGSYYLDLEGDLVLHMDTDKYVVVGARENLTDIGFTCDAQFLGGHGKLTHVKKITIMVEV